MLATEVVFNYESRWFCSWELLTFFSIIRTRLSCSWLKSLFISSSAPSWIFLFSWLNISSTLLVRRFYSQTGSTSYFFRRAKNSFLEFKFKVLVVLIGIMSSGPILESFNASLLSFVCFCSFWRICFRSLSVFHTMNIRFLMFSASISAWTWLEVSYFWSWRSCSRISLGISSMSAWRSLIWVY